MDYAVKHGTEAGRMQAKGYGETVPIVPNPTTEDDHARNRRVQFLVLETDKGATIVKDAAEAAPTAPEE